MEEDDEGEGDDGEEGQEVEGEFDEESDGGDQEAADDGEGEEHGEGAGDTSVSLEQPGDASESTRNAKRFGDMEEKFRQEQTQQHLQREQKEKQV